MPYRINYNGQQVSGIYETYAEVKRVCLAQADYSASINQAPCMWIQKYLGEGEWGRGNMTDEQREPHLHRR